MFLLLLALAHAGDSLFDHPGQSGKVAQLPPDVAAVVAKVADTAARHDWDSLLGLTDPAHRQMQVDEMQQPVELYVQELVGLHREGNELTPGPGGGRWPALDRLKTVDFQQYKVDGPWVEITGQWTLDNGEKRDARIFIAPVNGRLLLTGPVG